MQFSSFEIPKTQDIQGFQPGPTPQNETLRTRESRGIPISKEITIARLRPKAISSRQELKRDHILALLGGLDESLAPNTNQIGLGTQIVVSHGTQGLQTFSPEKFKFFDVFKILGT